MLNKIIEVFKKENSEVMVCGLNDKDEKCVLELENGYCHFADAVRIDKSEDCPNFVINSKLKKIITMKVRQRGY